MDSIPLVSIIINNYNYGRFLKDAIDSALNQTYNNIEVIVVDDGSADNSSEIIASYGNKIIPVFKENGGQGSAYNAGILKSNGLFFCMLDSDDTLLPEAIMKTKFLYDDKNIAKIQWPLWVADSNGNRNGDTTTKWTPPEGDLREMVSENGPFYDFHLHVGSIYRKSFFQHSFPMPEEEYRNGADVYLTTIAPIFGMIRNIMEPMGTYRIHGNNNYAGKSLNEDRIRNFIKRFETNCTQLHKHAVQMGYPADIDLWKERNFNYIWPMRLLEARQQIQKIIPDGCSFILINQDEWSAGEYIQNRKAIPFTDINGKYGGPPDDDKTAVEELERQIIGGVKFLVFWWTAFWWLNYYKELNSFLSNNFRIIQNTNSIIIYELKKNAS